MIELSNKPWGHPWHGIVTPNTSTLSGGWLALPNGQQMSYPRMPSSGRALLVQVPGLPEPENTPEDTAAGREWRNYAILSGSNNQLYGKSLGASSWLYIDPDGAPWLATSTLWNWLNLVEGNTVTVTLKKFGRFTEPPTEYQHSVQVPNLGQDEPAVFSGEGVWRSDYLTKDQILPMIHSINPQGSQVIYGLFCKSLVDGINMSVGWIELSISGPAANPSITISVLKNRQETACNIISASDAGAVWEYIVSVSHLPSGALSYTTCRYDSADEEVTLAEWEHVDYWGTDRFKRVRFIRTMQVEILIDGAVVSTYSFGPFERVSVLYKLSNFTSWQTQYFEYATYEGTTQTSEIFISPGAPSDQSNMKEMLQFYMHTVSFSEFSWRFYPMSLGNDLVSFTRIKRPAGSDIPVPGGIESVMNGQMFNHSIYASRHPVTREVVVSRTAVCWV